MVYNSPSDPTVGSLVVQPRRRRSPSIDDSPRVSLQTRHGNGISDHRGEPGHRKGLDWTPPLALVRDLGDATTQFPLLVRIPPWTAKSS